MKVLAYDPYPTSSSDYKAYAEFTDKLDEVLAQADFITLHVPSTANTRHFFGKNSFSK